MSIRAGRVLILVAAGLVCLGAGLSGCSSWKRLDDTSGLGNPSPDAATAAPDTTGSIVTQPAESGPSGEPVAPLSKPGTLGDDPNDDVQLGKKYFRANNFALAENHFQSAVEKHPNDAEAWIGLAASYDRLRRFDLADRAYAQVIRLIGPTVEVLNDEGFSYMLRGDYQRAYKLLNQAQAKDPGNPYVQANLKLLADAYRGHKAVQ
ncbi:MAG: tetratricopeptide repeat protein [Xanthobacteraceae bacterium]